MTPRPMYQLPKIPTVPWTSRKLVFGKGMRREVWLSGRWAWYDSTFRFNGGGYMGGARPYIEYELGPFRYRYYNG